MHRSATPSGVDRRTLFAPLEKADAVAATFGFGLLLSEHLRNSPFSVTLEMDLSHRQQRFQKLGGTP